MTDGMKSCPFSGEGYFMRMRGQKRRLTASLNMVNEPLIRAWLAIAGDDRLLLVAAGHAARDGDRPLPAAHVVLPDELFGVGAHRARIHKAVVRKLLFAVALEHHVQIGRAHV